MNTNKTYRPILAITMGDPAGIGPEIAAKTFAMEELYVKCRPLLVGHAATMVKTIKNLQSKLVLSSVNKIPECSFQYGTIDIFEVGGSVSDEIIIGQISAQAGDIAFQAVKAAIKFAMDKEVDGTVTGPIHKEALNLAGHQFAGHTEIYAHFTGTKKYAMLLADENIRVIHATTHVSLRKACGLIKKNRVLEVIQLMHDNLLKLGIKSPKIGVAGLNPHAGDGGLFGDEEIKEIIPAIQEARKSGIDAEGPIPADALFALANGGKYDGCVAMYHDQGHIPFKLLGFNWDKEKNTMKSVRGVNISLGLPIIRTSVDHGTAFEIAGKGVARPDALLQAIEYAIKLVN